MKDLQVGADELIDSVITTAVNRFATSEFLRFEGTSVTFAEFDHLTRSVSNQLLNSGYQKGDRIGIYMPNSLQWPIIWLGICRSEMIAVPINRNYTAAEVRYILDDSGVSGLIASPELINTANDAISDARRFPALWLASESVLGDLRMRSSAADRAPSIEGMFSETVANFQYTSGTTGFPKACVLAHRYWIDMGLLAGEAGEMSSSDVVLTSQPYSYIDPQWQTVMCLTFGATLVIEAKFSASRYWQSVYDNQATFLYVVGTMPTILYKQMPSENEACHNLRVVMCSAIPPDMHEAFELRWNVPWREVFGMTETGIDLYVPISDGELVGSGSAGKAVRTKRIRVVDENNSDMAPGEIGELAVSGTPMMLGYYGRPKETNEVLSDGWFKTGDLVQQDADGWVYVTGRIKDMVRRSGENISATEVESVLAKHESVQMSAVVPVLDPVRTEEVKAFIKLTSGSEGTADMAQSILEFAATQLASFKVPRFIEFVSSMPLTVSERVAKGQLEREDQRSGSYDREMGYRWHNTA